MNIRLAILFSLTLSLLAPASGALATQPLPNVETENGAAQDQTTTMAPTTTPAQDESDPVPPQVLYELEPVEAKIGEPVNYTILITHDGTKLFHLAANPGTGRLNITGKSHVTTTAGAISQGQPDKSNPAADESGNQNNIQPDDATDTTPEDKPFDLFSIFNSRQKQEPKFLFPIHQTLTDQLASMPAETAVEVFQFTMTAWKPGKAKLADFTIQYLDQSGREFSVLASGGTINFKSIIGTESMPQLIPPEPVGQVRVPVWWPIWLALGIGGAAIVAIGAFVLGRRLKNRKRETPAPPPVPAHEIALSSLDTLAAEKLAEDGQFKEFCLRISEIIREYLGARYGFDSLELTSTELLTALKTCTRRMKTQGDRLPDHASVQQFLEDTDMVKFAQYIPTMTEMDHFWRAARTIVTSTVPVYGDAGMSASHGVGEESAVTAGASPPPEATTPEATAPAPTPAPAPAPLTDTGAQSSDINSARHPQGGDA